MQYKTPRETSDRRYRRIITDEEIIHWHTDYYQQGYSIQKIAKKFHLVEIYVSKRFKALGLPISKSIAKRAYTPPDDR